MVVELFVTVALAGLLVLVYLAFFWKINWIRDLTLLEETTSKSPVARYKLKKNREIGQLPPVYPNGWFGLLESSRLRKGQVEHVAALGQNFAVYRSESNKVRIVNAYCPHLGANLAEGGVVKGEEIECPFHSWRFCGKTGKCASVPYAKNTPPAIKTKVWESTEANGVIFVWHHAEDAAPNWYPKPVTQIANGTWKFQARNEFYVNCHIQEIPENGADWAHLNAVHGASIFVNNLCSKIVHHSWTDAAWSSNYTSANQKEVDDESSEDSPQQDKHIAISRLKHSLVFFDKFSTLSLNVQAAQVGPGYVELHLQSTFGPMYIVQTVTPIQPMLQRVTHLMFSSMLLSPYARIAMIGESIMFERDVRIWNHKKYVENPVLVSEDKTIKAYRRWYKQFYSEKSPTYESCKDNMEW